MTEQANFCHFHFRRSSHPVDPFSLSAMDAGKVRISPILFSLVLPFSLASLPSFPVSRALSSLHTWSLMRRRMESWWLVSYSLSEPLLKSSNSHGLAVQLTFLFRLCPLRSSQWIRRLQWWWRQLKRIGNRVSQCFRNRSMKVFPCFVSTNLE